MPSNLTKVYNTGLTLVMRTVSWGNW